MHKLKTRVLIILISLITYACSDALFLAEGGIGGTGVSSGPVSGFGSIFVNGIKFDTSQAQVTIEGASATEDELQLGMIVTVVGEINEEQTQGSATTIRFNYTLQAEINSLDSQQNTLIAGGKTIHIDELTVFLNTSMKDLSTGDIIGVSGDILSNGEITAKYISQLTAIIVSGPSADIPSATMENISNAIDLSDIDLQTVTLSGLISARPANNRLVIQGKEIMIDANTVIINGSTNDLNTDTAIEVSASLDDSGNLNAQRIFIRRSASVHIEAAVDSINPDNASLVLAGISMRINASTLMQDSSNMNIRRFSLSDLGVGDNLVVYGRKEGDTIMLTRLQRKDKLINTTLSGPIGNAIVNPSFELFGQTINTATSLYRDNNGNSISAQTFFNQLSAGVAVEAIGTLSGTILIAESVTLL